jgi:hypothetical protein
MCALRTLELTSVGTDFPPPVVGVRWLFAPKAQDHRFKSTAVSFHPLRDAVLSFFLPLKFDRQMRLSDRERPRMLVP